MELKTFRAYSMAEALAAVKQQLGHDAVILNTRSYQRGGLLGIGRKTVIEVIATPATEAPDRTLVSAARSRTASTDVRTPLARRAYAAAQKPPNARPSSAPPSETDRERTRRLALAMAEQHQREKAATAPTSERAASTTRAHRPAHESGEKAPRDMNEAVGAAPPGPARAAEMKPAVGAEKGEPRRFILTPTEVVGASPVRAALGQTPTTNVDVHANPEVAVENNVALMQSELGAIKDLVSQVLQRQVKATGDGRLQPAMPQKLFDMYLKLLAQELSEDMADSIINQVRDELTLEQLEDENLVRVSVMRHLARYIPTADKAISTASPDGRPLTIALIGPTGVGKTTTLAKIAATFKLHRKKHVGLITADTYRIAAVDQLRTYANIIGLPLKVTLTPAEMRQAVHALSDCDVILIDTAGRSQNDEGRLGELKQFIEAADPHEVHLVLSSTASEKVMLNEAEAFSAVGVDKVVLTKLDEAVSFGMLVNVLRHVGKKLSFITTGQEVPDHIEHGEPDRIASLILEGKMAS